MNDQTSKGQETAARLFEAEALIDRRRYREARQVLHRVLNEEPGSIHGLYLAAFVDYAEDNNVEALEGVNAVLRIEPSHYGGRRLRAIVLEEKGEAAASEGEWISLLRDYPEDADSYSGYAALMLRSLVSDKARLLAAEGLRHDPDHEGCLYVMALLDVIEGRSAKGADPGAALQRLLQQHPDRMRSSLALVTTLSNAGDQRGALRIARELLRTEPDSAQLVELVKELRYASHWSMKPLYPLQKWGWGGSVMLYIGAVIVLALGKNLPRPLYLVLVIGWFGYCIYSWVWPQLLKRLLG